LTTVDPGPTRAPKIRTFLRRHAIDTRPLRHPPYRRLFVGNVVGTFGIQFTAVAVPVQMYELTRSSLWVGLLGVAGLVPLIAFSIWGGAVADRVDRRRLLLVSSGLQWTVPVGLLVVALGVAAVPGGAARWVLLGFTALQAAAFAVSAPTRQAIIVRLVQPAELPAANALNTMTFNLGLVAGPLMAGLFVARGEFAAAYAIDAALFTVALWATYRLPSIPPVPVPGAGETVALQGRIAGWRDIRAGFAFLFTAPVLLLSFAIDIVAMVLAMPRSLFPEVADERFGDGSIGWLYAAISIGSVLAGLTSGWIGRVRRQGLALVLAVVAWGLAVGLAGLAPSLWLAVLLLAMGGAADLISAVYRQSILQTYAPDGMQGRMQGVFIAVVAGGPRLGDLRAGAMAALVGPTVAWVSGGIAAAAVAAVLALAFPALLRYPSAPARR
jgi:MFS family permease